MQKSDYKKSIHQKTKQIEILQKVLKKLNALQERKERAKDTKDMEGMNEEFNI